MKYSAVLVATLAVGAFARAVPEGTGPDPALKEIKNIPGSAASEYQDQDTYKPDTDPTYKPKDNNYKPDNTYKKDDKKDSYKPDNSYKKDDKKDSYDADYTKKYDDWKQKYYAPAKKDSYEDKKAKEGDKYKPYSPEPPSYDDKKSCYDKFEWPLNVHKEQPCPVKWQPKHGGDWKDDDDTTIYLYHCKDYSKPHSKVCDNCGHGEYKDWSPPSDCESSDSDNGYMYRFKFVKKGDESSCTWGEEFPIYGDKYDDKKEAECPPPAPVPDCPPQPPSPPAKAPEAAPAYPAPAAPAAAPEAAPAAYPAATAPTQGVANETTVAPVSYGASSAIRASLSVIVGVAALVTFAL